MGSSENDKICRNLHTGTIFGELADFKNHVWDKAKVNEADAENKVIEKNLNKTQIDISISSNANNQRILIQINPFD